MSANRFEGTESYVATQDLMLAVNAAITLGRPLLVKGEPGTGKTMLAEEVAGAIGAPPAFVNAVVDALHERTGLTHLDMPLTPQKTVMWKLSGGRNAKAWACGPARRPDATRHSAA